MIAIRKINKLLKLVSQSLSEVYYWTIFHTSVLCIPKYYLTTRKNEAVHIRIQAIKVLKLEVNAGITAKLNHAAIPSFVSYFILDSYFNFHRIFFTFSVQLYLCDCSIRMTAILVEMPNRFLKMSQINISIMVPCRA